MFASAAPRTVLDIDVRSQLDAAFLVLLERHDEQSPLT
jgi:hypothetical protein